MPKIEPGSSPAYNALRPPQPPPRPVGGLRGRTVRSPGVERHEHSWGRPVGDAAPRRAGTTQQPALRARAVSIPPSPSERFLPGSASGAHAYQNLPGAAPPDVDYDDTVAPARTRVEGVYQSLQATDPEHVYADLNARARVPEAPQSEAARPAASGREPGEGVYQGLGATDPEHVYADLNARAPSAGPQPDADPWESSAEEPHYEFGPQERPDPDADLPVLEPPFEGSYGDSLFGDDGQQPSELGLRDPTTGEPIYDVPQSTVYETPTPPALGSLDRLGAYLVNSLEGGTIPRELKDDLQTAVVYAKQLDQDIGRAATLLGKLDAPGGTLTASERQEVQSLIASNKHNLNVVHAWLAGRQEELGQAGTPSPQTRFFLQALQTRIADRHMDIADLTCLYDLDEASPDEPVSREDRCNAHLLDAEAAVAVAQDLEGVDPAVKERLVADLERHRDLLVNLKDAAGGRLQVASDSRLTLAARELWDTPVPLQKNRAGSSRDVAALRAQWRNTAPGQVATLPVAHAKVGQARMLQEFIRFRLEEETGATGGTPDLKRRFQAARNRAINDQPWGEVTNRVRTSMPDHPERTVAVESRIVPGRALAEHFAERYPSNGVNCGDRTQYKHVPNLAQTSLTNESGEVLFSGLRHGVLDAYDIDAAYLASLPDADLRTMIADLLVPEAPADGARDALVEARLASIRSDPRAAQRAAEAMRAQASREMASEMAAAALVADPDKLQFALAGETVDVALSSISVLTPDSLRRLTGNARSDERTMLNHQTDALRQLEQGNPVELHVRDDDNVLHTVNVNVRLRQFNFGVNAGAVGRSRIGPVSIPSQTPGWRNLMGWGFAMERNNPQLQRLLGGTNAAELGGDVAERLFEMRNEASEVADEIAEIEMMIREQDGEDNSDLEAEAATARARQATLDKRIESLDSAARQAKAIWARNDYREGGGDPFKMVSRLALIGHLMGETPLFNCKSGKDRTGQLDAEVKFLAAAADESGGRVPAPDESMEAWRPVRNEFVFNTGNLEMQRMNTGMPGYKLAGVPGLANAMHDGMKPLYRGGSAYVSS